MIRNPYSIDSALVGQFNILVLCESFENQLHAVLSRQFFYFLHIFPIGARVDAPDKRFVWLTRTEIEADVDSQLLKYFQGNIRRKLVSPIDPSIAECLSINS